LLQAVAVCSGAEHTAVVEHHGYFALGAHGDQTTVTYRSMSGELDRTAREVRGRGRGGRRKGKVGARMRCNTGLQPLKDCLMGGFV
jgi:hypothetical protein